MPRGCQTLRAPTGTPGQRLRVEGQNRVGKRFIRVQLRVGDAHAANQQRGQGGQSVGGESRRNEVCSLKCRSRCVETVPLSLMSFE